MRWSLMFALLALLVVLSIQKSGTETAFTDNEIDVFFSPNGGSEAAILREIGNARKSLDVQAYYMTNSAIIEAIGKAHERRIKVRVILDKSQITGKFSAATYLVDHNVAVYIDSEHEISHNKVMIFDGVSVLTGSMNFTKAAERENAENILILHNRPKVAKAYLENFEKHLDHSKKFKKD